VNIRAQLNSGRLLILDGATGTELTRRGVDTRLPLWSAAALIQAPQVVRQIHLDYVRAGADLITANTFRTHRRSLARGGMGERARELTHLAVMLARATVPQGRWLAGSISPLEDCYCPDLVPPDDELRREHAEMAGHLVEAGVDVLLVETMNTAREARIAAEAASATGLPVLVSFVCSGATGQPGAPADTEHLLSGERIADAVRTLDRAAPAAVLVNCVPAARIAGLLQTLRSATDLPIGAYGNVGHADEHVGWTLTNAVSPERYAAAALSWRAAGASIIGGCCGTTPAHIQALADALVNPSSPICGSD
jgi:S-methylmethionine-dependent homocysteine/selenocysteine methylase